MWIGTRRAHWIRNAHRPASRERFAVFQVKIVPFEINKFTVYSVSWGVFELGGCNGLMGDTEWTMNRLLTCQTSVEMPLGSHETNCRRDSLCETANELMFRRCNRIVAARQPVHWKLNSTRWWDACNSTSWFTSQRKKNPDEMCIPFRGACETRHTVHGPLPLHCIDFFVFFFQGWKWGEWFCWISSYETVPVAFTRFLKWKKPRL